MTRNRPNIGDWRWFDNNMCAVLVTNFKHHPEGITIPTRDTNANPCNKV